MIILGILWLIVTVKAVLFWVCLWQLKEYHVGRFADHFRTAKGKALLFDKLRIVKLAIVVSFIFNPLVLFALTPLIYLAEAGKIVPAIYKKKILKPIFTRKIIFVVLVSIFSEIAAVLAVFDYIEGKVWLSVFFFPLLLLIIDLLTPFIVALLVLLFKPITYFSVKMILLRAGRKRDQFKDLIVIGITGSYGKTSTKEILYDILSEKFRVIKTKKHINAEVGIAKTILDDLKEEHQILIAEIGAYNVGKIKEVCRVIKPKIGILTGINEQHMATFGSQEKIIKAKHEIFECLPENGIKILRDRIKLKAEQIVGNKDNVLFRVNGVDFKLNMLGRHNIENVLLAVDCAMKLGMTLEEISKACSKIRPELGGMTLFKKESPTIIDSSYSSNPTGVISDLEYLKLYAGKKAVVMPCLIELGKSSKDVHQRIGKKLNEACDLAIITSKERFDVIKKECPKAIYSEDGELITQKLKECDVVLLEGRTSKNILDKIKCI